MQSSQQSCDSSGAGKQGQAGPRDRPRRARRSCPAVGADFSCLGGSQHPGPVGEGSCNCGRRCNPRSRDKAETALLTIGPKAKVLKVKKPLASKHRVAALQSIWREMREKIVQVSQLFAPATLCDLQLPEEKD